jgi:hypothetical protein
MERSVLIAKLIGPVFLTIGFGLLLNQNTYWDMTNEVLRHPTPTGSMLIYVSGVTSMLAGLAVVNAHPLWTRDWRVIITIIGWLMLIIGIVRIVIPDLGVKAGSALYTSPTSLVIAAIISLMFGGFLSFKGYWTET